VVVALTPLLLVEWVVVEVQAMQELLIQVVEAVQMQEEAVAQAVQA
jgi:hypothetical protein